MGNASADTQSTALLPNGGQRKTRNLILNALSHGRKLTNTEIHCAVNEKLQADRQVTYQGVRKAILGLCVDGVLQKESDKYFVSPSWAQETSKVAGEIAENAKTGGVMPFEEMPPLWSQTIEIDGVAEAYYFALRQLIKARDSLNLPNPVVACIQPHSLPLTMVKKEEYAATIQLKGAHYIACAGGTALDKANLEVWQKVGAITAMNCNVPKTADTAVTGEFIIEILLPTQMRNKVNQLFKNSKGLDPESLISMQQAWFNTKTISTVRISRNGERAKRLTEKIIDEVRNRTPSKKI